MTQELAISTPCFYDTNQTANRHASN